MSFFKRLRSFLWREKLDAELDDELQFHLGQRTQAFIDEGMTPREARHAARRAFGNVGSLKEETRDSWGFRLLETLWQDVRYGARMLVRNPGFAVVAVLTLARTSRIACPTEASFSQICGGSDVPGSVRKRGGIRDSADVYCGCDRAKMVILDGCLGRKKTLAPQATGRSTVKPETRGRKFP